MSSTGDAWRGQWFRIYRAEATQEPTLQMCAPEDFRSWFNLLCLASKHDGDLPLLNQVSYWLRATSEQASATLERLIDAGLFERRDDGGYRASNWEPRQYRSVSATQRVRELRKTKRFSNISETGKE